MRKILVLAMLFISNVIVIYGQSSFDVADYVKRNVSISALQFSPDGNTLVYTITKVDWENNRRKTEYILLDVATKKQQELNFKQRNVTSLSWSPSGKYMSYLALSDTTGASLPQLYIKELSGDEAMCITTSKSGVINYSWSPNEDKIVYIAKDLPAIKEGTNKFVQAFEVGNNSYVTTTPSLAAHMFLINSKGGIAKRLTNGSWTVRVAKWITDSTIIFTKGETPYSGDLTKSKSVVYDINSGQIINLTQNSFPEFNPTPSPDKNTIAFLSSKNGMPENILEISLISIKDKKVLKLTDKLDRTISAFQWMPDTKALVLSTLDGAKAGLVIIGVDKKADRLPLRDVASIGDFAISKGGLIALSGSTSIGSAEIYFLNPSTTALEKVTSYNSFLEKFPLGKTEALEWKTSAGLTADGIITYPPGFIKGKKYPLVLYIHGGPTASSNISFNPFVQHLAANEWIVFQPNYRGSNNRGNRFQGAIANDGGNGPGEDIIKGVELLKQKGFVDEKKIAVTGWSYGGYMTAWLIGKYPAMWKAAVAGAAPVDVTDMSSLTDLNVMIRHALTSSPWKGDNYKKYYEMSPISNLSKVRTPTLIMSVVSDERVSITGSYKLYHALKANDVPVQFIAYPGTAHFPADPVNANDVYQRWTLWLKKYLN